MKQTYEAKDLAEIAAEFRRRADAADRSSLFGEGRASAWKDAADILEVTTLKPEVKKFTSEEVASVKASGVIFRNDSEMPNAWSGKSLVMSQEEQAKFQPIEVQPGFIVHDKGIQIDQ